MTGRRIALLLLMLMPLATACGDNGDDGNVDGGGTDGGTDGGAGAFDGLDAAQTLDIPGLEGRVEVLRDEYGMPHVYCQVELDCIRAEGYLQAHDRLFEMDFYRRVATGELGSALVSTVAGQARSQDRFYKRMFTGPDGRPVMDAIEEGLDPEIRSVVQAFADGVNAYIADLGQPWAPVSPQYAFPFLVTVDGDNPPPEWTVYDTLAIARFFTFDLSGTFEAELEAAGIAAGLGADFPVLYPARPMDETLIVPGYYESGASALTAAGGPSLEPATIDRLRGLDWAGAGAEVKRARLRLAEHGEDIGSNNWIVDGAHSATGNALVANDPHLSLLAPSIWWEVHMDAESLEGAEGTLNVAGTIFPGTPGVIIGHNQHLAWGETVAGYDVTDVYVETVTGVDTVSFNGEDVAVEKTVVDFSAGPDQTVQEKICYVPHHGPIVTTPEGFTDAEFADPAEPCVDPARGSTAITAKWTGQEPTYEVNFLWMLDKATNLDEARAAIDEFGVGAQNFIVGDTAGNILYYPHANVPVRDWDLTQNPPYLPLPGTGEAEWNGYLPNDQLPQAENPAAGFVATANNDLVGTTLDNDPVTNADGAPYLYYTRDLGLRAGRITRLLEGAMTETNPPGADYLVPDGVVSIEEMQAIQNDTYFEFAEWITPYLLDAADAAPDQVTELGLGDAVQLLRDWTFAAPTGLTGWDPLDPAVTDPQVLNDAAATTLFHTWLWKAMDATFLDELKAAGVTAADATTGPRGQPFQKAFFFQLRGDTGYEDDRFFDDVSTPDTTEARAEVLLGALSEAVAQLQADARLGAEPTDWLWGRVHVVPFPSPVGLVAGQDNDPYTPPDVANDGALHTVDVANSYDSYRQSSGPSMRHVTDVDADLVDSWEVITGGIIDLAANANQRDQTDLWLNGEYKHYPFTLDAAIEAAKARDDAGLDAPAGRWTLQPAP